MPPPATGLTASRLEEEALRLARHGALRAAAEVCRTLTTGHPQFAAGWQTASSITLQMGDAAAALADIERALALAPKDGRALLQKARCLRALRRLGEALELARSVRQLTDEDTAGLDALGTFYSQCGEPQPALEAYDRALQLAPRNVAIAFNRAAVRGSLGHLAAAEEDYDHVIRQRPNDFEAWKNRSDLRTQTRDRNHVAELEKLLQGGISDWRGEVEIRYALAKEYEDLGEHARSWTHLETGAKLHRRKLVYHVERDVATIDWIIEAFAASPPAAVQGPASRESTLGQPIMGQPTMGQPIFIIGLPRSGITVVERILGSHSGVHPAGELNELSQALFDAVTRTANTKSLERQELVARSAKVDFAALGREYIERTRPPRKPYFTDRMPLNYLYCGIIRRALPNARIVHLTRHPLAACYAMYKTLFREAYPFSYKLEEIGRYYIAYRRLMTHWQNTLPGAIRELSYERLVSDPLREVRGLFEYCSLEWEQTPHVRQSLYDASLTRWRNYSAQLEGLRTQLVAAGLEVDN
jgi:tetratricopeptide (TPR) repeat protein